MTMKTFKILFFQITICVVTLCFVFNLQAQNTAYNQRDNFGQAYFNPNVYLKQFKDFEGSPYLMEDYVLAKINDNKINRLVRFNKYSGKIEVQVAENKAIELPDDKSFEIRLLNGTDRYFKTGKYLSMDGKKEYSFFEKVYDGTGFTLFKKENVRFIKSKEAGAYSNPKPAKFQNQNPTFLLQKKGSFSDQVVELSNNRKKFLSMFPEKEKEVLKSFIKENKSDLKEKNDMVNILKEIYSD